MALLRYWVIFGTVLVVACQSALPLESETISFDSVASNFNSNIVVNHRGEAEVDNLGLFYSLAQLEQRGPKFNHKYATSSSHNVCGLRGEPVEIVLQENRCSFIIVGHYADKEAAAKYELPLGIVLSQSLTNTFKYLRQQNIIIDELTKEDQAALRLYYYGRSELSPEQIEYAESCPVRNLKLRSDGNGYSRIFFKYKSQYPINLYYYKEEFIGIVIGWHHAPYFPELCVPDAKQIPGPLGEIRKNRNKWKPVGLENRVSNNIGIVE